MNLTPWIILAFIWGCIWAALLQFTGWGKYLAACRTWITVVIGVGIDLLILLAVMPLTAWLNVVLVIVVSSVGIIFRSLGKEWGEHQELMRAARGDSDTTGE